MQNVPDQACVKVSTRTPAKGASPPPGRGIAARSPDSHSARSEPISSGAERRCDQDGGVSGAASPGPRAVPSPIPVETKNFRAANCSFSSSSRAFITQPEMQRNSASLWNSGQRSIPASSRATPACTSERSRA